MNERSTTRGLWLDRRQVLGLGAGAALTSLIGGWARAIDTSGAVRKIMRS